ncbi:EspA/EspE family type VII secretion system effector [Mycolicibacterium sp. 624]|uniref:EspA/EspE family type VII secretion system effector n=1 Tax=Mycolicibacterium sp. 624 TaxID=3156314 RepID=UPI00339933C9
MGALDGFYRTWSNARSTFGEGTPWGGESFDASPTLRQLQSNLVGAKPSSQWSGSAADSYSTANDKQAHVLGEMANLDQRLRAEVDRSASVVSAGRRDLETVRQWVQNAAASIPNLNSAQGQRMLMPIVSKGSGEIAEILQRSNAESNAIARRIRGLDGEYRMLGGDLKLGEGKDPDDGPQMLVGDKEEPWRYPWEPPPPSDSAPGGGRWDLGQGYPPGPNGGPPMGPIAPPSPWSKDLHPPIAGGPSGLQDVVAPSPNGWGVKPPLVLKEAYKFRVTGETFNGAPDHVQWVQRDGMWHQAQWVDYNFEAEHLRQLVGNISMPPTGLDRWQPIDIKDIYAIQVDNPRLPLYVPNPFGGQVMLDPKRPAVSAG